MNRMLLLKVGAATVIPVLAGIGAYVEFYRSPRQAIENSIASSVTRNRELEEQLADSSAVVKRLKEIGSATLGSKDDVVADRFRSSLGRLAEECGLTELKTNSGAPKAMSSPLTQAGNTKIQSSLRKALKKSSDFEVISGTLEGTGTLEQVLRTLALVEAQPWVHRLEGFSISLAGRERERFKLKLELATLFVPDLAPSKDPELVQSAASVGSESILRTIATRNPFKEPVPPAPAPVVAINQPAPVVAQAPAPGYGDWRLTSVVSGRRGMEAWLVNSRTSERRVLMTGDRVIEAQFVEGSGERAVFDIGGQRFELFNGDSLASRRALKQ